MVSRKEAEDMHKKKKAEVLNNHVSNLTKKYDLSEYEHLDEALGLIAGWTDFLDLANKFYKIQPYFYDKGKIWWLWDHDKFCWVMCDEIDLFNKIDNAVRRSFTIQSKVKNEIIESMKRVGRARMPKKVPKTVIQFKDICVDITNGEEFTPTPDYFITNPVNWDIGDSEDTPTMDKIFIDWVGEEEALSLYEIIAYSMLPDYPLHRIFCLNGSGSNGKGKFLQLITNFLGTENTCSTELDVLIGSRFEMGKLYKKLLCTMGETNFSVLNKTSLLKKLSGGDLVSFEFKNKGAFDDYNYAKILIATNSLPVTYDKTQGFFRRWKIINFPNQFTEKKDILKEIPEEEYNNLARKSIKILIKLLKTREFNNEGSIEQRKAIYEELSNPLIAFMREMCLVEPDGFVSMSNLVSSAQIYLKERGHRVMSWKEISDYFANDGFYKARKRVIYNGVLTENPVWCFMGLSLKKKVVSDVSDVPSISTYFPIGKLIEKGDTSDTSDTDKLIVTKYGLTETEVTYHNCVACEASETCYIDVKGRNICKDCAEKHIKQCQKGNLEQ